MTRKKTYMPESDIQEYEMMDAGRLGDTFFSSGPAAAGIDLIRLLRSYRIAANVAHSAWRMLDEMDRRSDGAPIATREAVEELRARLKLFAPQVPAFWPPKAAHEYGCRMLEELYDWLLAVEVHHPGELMERAFQFIEHHRHALRSGG